MSDLIGSIQIIMVSPHRVSLDYPNEFAELFVEVARDRRLTLEQLRTNGKRFGAGLQQQWSWRKGDVLVIMAPNTIDLVPATFGALLVGGVICPLNPTYTIDELVSQLASSKATGLITSVSCLRVAHEAASKVGLPANRILLVGDIDATSTTSHFSSLHSTANRLSRVNINPAEDLAFLVYSSGTTGLPKGVMLTHRNIIANSIQSAAAEGSDLAHWKIDRVLGFLPMYHIYGKSIAQSHRMTPLTILGIAVLMLAPLHRGVTTYIMQKFELQEFCKTVEREKITIAYIVPPVALALAKAPIVDQFSLQSLRYMHSSAAQVPQDIIVAVHKRHGIPIRQGYGLSEASPGVCSQRIEDWKNSIGASGRLMPSMVAKIVNEGEEVPTGNEGEICLKGPNIFKGYYDNPTATAQSFDADGWYRTGDLGHVDDQGNIYITDRLKELIKYNGFQVAPAQLEGVLLGHAAVDDVAVIGIYSKARATELPRAYIVVAQPYVGDDELKQKVQKWFDERVSPHKKLRGGIRFVKEIPKSHAGKILRRVLAEQAKSEQTEDEVMKARL